MTCRQLDNSAALGVKEWNSGNDDRVGSLSGKGGKAVVKFAFGADLDNMNLPAKREGRVLQVVAEWPKLPRPSSTLPKRTG
jgi:predicted NUDIX family NTP pyrophosphohydrolase